MKYYSVIKRKELQIHTKTWMNLKTTQETQTGALYQSRGVGWGRKWEGGSKGKGYVYTYGWFMLKFDRKQQNSIKQLSFNKKINYKRKKRVVESKVKPSNFICLFCLFLLLLIWVVKWAFSPLLLLSWFPHLKMT